MTQDSASDDLSPVLEIRRIGGSVGLILPQDLLARLKLKEGDKLQIVEQTDGSLKLALYDQTHARGLQIARQAFRDYADTFKALAK